MIESKVLKTKSSIEIGGGITLPKNKEIEIVRDVIYIDGYLVPPEVQLLLYNYIASNKHLFDDVTRIW